MTKAIRILGIRGVPAAHGGFETFAEHLSLYLVARGWKVTVYCQEEAGSAVWEDSWEGVRRIHIPVKQQGPVGTVVFDWHAVRHAASAGEPCLTLGYNTAVFCALLRARGVRNVINMDGIEWARKKWGPLERAWFYVNDWFGCWVGNHLVADHPRIKDHLATRVSPDKITTIPYGADSVSAADEQPVRELGLEPRRYFTVIARPEPENSILEIVRGFSRRPRGMTLLVLGKYSTTDNAYHKAVVDAAGPEVRFVGAIYDKAIVHSLRFHCAAYIHGHQVGGTNPSLVEALGAGNAVVAHDNQYNRWVAGDGARYFSDEEGVDAVLQEIVASLDAINAMRSASRARYVEHFTWGRVLSDYETLLLQFQ